MLEGTTGVGRRMPQTFSHSCYGRDTVDNAVLDDGRGGGWGGPSRGRERGRGWRNRVGGQTDGRAGMQANWLFVGPTDVGIGRLAGLTAPVPVRSSLYNVNCEFHLKCKNSSSGFKLTVTRLGLACTRLFETVWLRTKTLSYN